MPGQRLLRNLSTAHWSTLHMPVMNGFETCLRLQAQATALGRTLRVWFIAGAPTRLVERRAVELGAFGVFSKPFAYPAFVEQMAQGFSSPLPILPTLIAEDHGESSQAEPLP